MALTGWLKIPGIGGEALDRGHEGDIDIYRMTWAVAQTTPAQTGRGRTRSRPMVDRLTCHKRTDAASVYLALACLQGKSFPEMVATLRRETGGAAHEHLTVTLRNVVVTGFDMDTGRTGPEGERDADETVSLSFERIGMLYSRPRDGRGPGEEHEIDYDIMAGV